MNRKHDARGFRIVPASDRFDGMTALRVDAMREIVCLGTGPKVEALLLDKLLGKATA